MYMKNQIRSSATAVSIGLVAMLFAAAPVLSQTEISKPSAPAKPWTQPVTADGQPDFQGYWGAIPTGTFDITDPRTGGGRLDEILKVRSGQVRVQKPSRIIDPPDGNVPYQPWAAAKQKDLASHIDDPTKPEHIDPGARCLLNGATRGFFHTGFSITQVPGYVIFQWEQNSEYRIVPLDGSRHVGEDLKLWQGDSRGHWEGNTLVIDVTNLNAKTRLDMVGNFYSDEAHVVERFTRVDDKTIKYEAVITDPTVYTRPWTIAGKFNHTHIKDADYELWEDACHEGERSAEKMIIPENVAKENAARAKASGKVSH
jgi:hypothetical protein